MKNLGLFEKFLFFINSVIAFLFLGSLLIPYLSPSIFSQFSILSIFSPLIIIANILFLFFWIAKLKRQFILSLVVLIIGIDSLRSFINFSNNSRFLGGNEISIISYNVRLFNIYKWIEEDNVYIKIRDFLNEKNPDIICLQEFQNSNFKLDKYPYMYEKLRDDFEENKYIQAKYLIDIFVKLKDIKNAKGQTAYDRWMEIKSEITVPYMGFNASLKEFTIGSS